MARRRKKENEKASERMFDNACALCIIKQQATFISKMSEG
jgi:hypothetical protein